MTDVEQLLRDALNEIPTPVAPTTDPLAQVDRRVRRARRRIALAAGAAVVAVVAGVAVPLLATGNGAPSGLQVGRSPSSSPSPSHGGPPGSELATTVKAPGPVVSVSTSSTGSVYALGSWQVSSGAAFLGVVKGDQVTDLVTVPAPADEVIAAEPTAGGAIAYVIGTNRTTGQSSLTPVYTLTGGGSSGGLFGGPLPGRAVAATAADRSLYVLTATPQGMEVDRYVSNKAGTGLADSHPIQYASRLVTDAGGQAWVQTDKELIPLVPQAQSFSFGRPVPWTGHQPIYGPAEPSGIWAYDGRLIELTPPLLASGMSVAEGWRLNTTDVPSAAVSVPGGGVYYGVRSAPSASDNGVYYYSRRSMTNGASRPDVGLGGFGVSALAAAPDGGVLLVRTSGQLQHWTPAAAGSR